MTSPLLAVVMVAWSLTLIGMGAALGLLARSLSALSACYDIGGMLLSSLGGALVPLTAMPSWIRHIAPASPGYWAVSALEAALRGEEQAGPWSLRRFCSRSRPPRGMKWQRCGPAAAGADRPRCRSIRGSRDDGPGDGSYLSRVGLASGCARSCTVVTRESMPSNGPMHQRPDGFVQRAGDRSCRSR